MSMKSTGGLKFGTARHVTGWIRRILHKQIPSAPVRSVTMKEDDLDHLGALHQVIGHRTKR